MSEDRLPWPAELQRPIRNDPLVALAKAKLRLAVDADDIEELVDHVDGARRMLAQAIKSRTPQKS
jgi:hypothetical protein